MVVTDSIAAGPAVPGDAAHAAAGTPGAVGELDSRCSSHFEILMHGCLQRAVPSRATLHMLLRGRMGLLAS